MPCCPGLPCRDRSHTRCLGHLGHEIDVAADIHGARIDEALQSEILQLLEAIDRVLEGRASFELWRCAVQFPSGPADEQMLVHQSGAELFGGRGSRDGIYGFHRSNSFAPASLGLETQIRPARSKSSNAARRHA